MKTIKLHYVVSDNCSWPLGNFIVVCSTNICVMFSLNFF